MKILPEMYLWTAKNFGTYSHLDPDQGILEGFFNVAIIALSGKTDWIFVKILTDYREFLWTSKSSLNFETHSDTVYGYRSGSPWRRSAFSEWLALVLAANAVADTGEVRQVRTNPPPTVRERETLWKKLVAFVRDKVHTF